MLKTWTHRKACRLCNSRHVVPAFKLNYTPPATAFVRPDGTTDCAEKIPLIVTLCENCKHVQSLDVVDPALLFDNYIHSSLKTLDTVQHADWLVQEAISRGHVQKGDLVVDIGSGNGALLKAFKKAGMKVIGIDPSPHSAAQSIVDGVTIYGELFTPALSNRISKEHGLASLVTAEYVLGSIDNLHAVATGVRHILKPEGLFCFLEPYLADMLEQNLFDLVQHERISYFSALPLEPFFRSVHMHLIEAKRIDYRGGSLCGIVQRADGPHVVSTHLKELVDKEKSTKLQSIDTLNSFAARVEEMKIVLNGMVSDFKSQGKHVAGYGASGRTVSFVHEFGWTSDIIEFIADENPHKHGLFLPGTTIPVVHPGALKDHKPDVIIIFAYNHREQIIQLHAEFRRGGGKFIVPFPMPSLI